MFKVSNPGGLAKQHKEGEVTIEKIFRARIDFNFNCNVFHFRFSRWKTNWTTMGIHHRHWIFSRSISFLV